MQKEKINRPFLKYSKAIINELRIQKLKEWQNKFIEGCIYLFRGHNCNFSLFSKVTSYVCSGFSIIFIGYVLMNILTNYPPRVIGISP
jgi:hypothetical protein